VTSAPVVSATALVVVPSLAGRPRVPSPTSVVLSAGRASAVAAVHLLHRHGTLNRAVRGGVPGVGVGLWRAALALLPLGRVVSTFCLLPGHAETLVLWRVPSSSSALLAVWGHPPAARMAGRRRASSVALSFLMPLSLLGGLGRGEAALRVHALSVLGLLSFLPGLRVQTVESRNLGLVREAAFVFAPRGVDFGVVLLVVQRLSLPNVVTL